MPTISETPEISGAFFADPDVHSDERGMFVETYRRQWFPAGREMIQSNRGDRSAGCIVGLHYHLHQSDYWYITTGTARVVLHDLRQGSSTDGNTLCFDLGVQSDGQMSHRGVYIPPGVAHGFASLTDLTITYLVDGYYNPADELGVAWDDPAIAADWGLEDPVLSARDAANRTRDELDPMWQPHMNLRTG